MLNATDRREQESLCRLTEADDTLRGRICPSTRASLFVILPDHFGATFVDLHVHHTARVDVGGQVDLRELHLGGGEDEENTQPDIRWHVLQEQERGQICHKSLHEGGGATDTH